MLSVQRITPDNMDLFKAVRLRALQDAPSAFGSTYEREATLRTKTGVRGSSDGTEKWELASWPSIATCPAESPARSSNLPVALRVGPLEAPVGALSRFS